MKKATASNAHPRSYIFNLHTRKSEQGCPRVLANGGNEQLVRLKCILIRLGKKQDNVLNFTSDTAVKHCFRRPAFSTNNVSTSSFKLNRHMSVSLVGKHVTTTLSRGPEEPTNIVKPTTVPAVFRYPFHHVLYHFPSSIIKGIITAVYSFPSTSSKKSLAIFFF